MIGSSCRYPQERVFLVDSFDGNSIPLRVNYVDRTFDSRSQTDVLDKYAAHVYLCVCKFVFPGADFLPTIFSGAIYEDP